MSRLLTPVALVTTLCLAVSITDAAQRGRGGAKEGGERNAASREGSSRKTQGEGSKSAGNKAPGGEWSERSHSGPTNHAQTGGQGEHSAAAGAAATNRNGTSATGKQGAAAGAAAANRNAPAATGAQGAAAGAAAVNRNNPTATGAQGAAAGAAAANRNSPPVSGAQGAAAGAAAANRNSPQLSGAQGAAAGAAVANRNSPEISGAAGYAAVRNSANTSGFYGSGWYGAHPNAWVGTGWGAGGIWAPTAWGTFAGMYGYGNNTPLSYNYGGNVAYQNGNVVMNGQSLGTASAFSQQAADLAETGAQADVAGTEKWLPLGVFAMVRNEQQHPQLILQMAVNEQGILRGNYTDEVSGHTAPIHGAVDKQTQRAAWTVGDNKSTVMEAGLNNLTQNEAPALIHKNGKTDHWILVRLEQPKEVGAAPTESGR
ncbi:MAG TPA: hypothetical protein VGG64_15505 [Pirellulales bacterium]|jgi:hypothetical protein